MNLELNNHKITLGPKALAFIETSMRGMGETYCRDQLALWLAGGKCDPDVTIEGPARFVARGNAIGIPMMPKAGAEARERGSLGPGSAEPLPVASAAPADLYEPVGTMPQRGDRVVCLVNPEDNYPWVNRLHEEGARFASEDGTFEVRDGEFNRYDDRGWRVLKRQAPPAHGLQVWRDGEWLDIMKDGEFTAFRTPLGLWGQPVKPYPTIAVGTIVTGPEADAAIEEAREQGVLSWA